MKKFTELSIGEKVYVMKDDFHLQTGTIDKVYEGQPTTDGESGVMVKINTMPLQTMKEIVIRKSILSEGEYENFRKSRETNVADKTFNSAVKTTEEVINAAGDFAGKVKESFNKFKGQVITDELIERMKKEAEGNFDPKVAKEKIETASEVLGGAVENMFSKFMKDEKDH